MSKKGISGTKYNLGSGTGIKKAFEEIMKPNLRKPENITMPTETTEFPLDLDKLAIAAQRNYDYEELADFLDVEVGEIARYKDHPQFKRALARGRRLRKDKIYDGFDALVSQQHPRMIELGAKTDLGMNPTTKVEAKVDTVELTKEERDKRLRELLTQASS